MTENRKIDTAALLAGVDIVKVIDGYVPLTKSGAEFEACCPFHTESTPSFKVNPVKQFYHCFGCGAHGDAIGFLVAYRGINFLDACRELGADIPEGEGPVSLPKPLPQRAPAKEKPGAEWTPVLPAPPGVEEAPLAHPYRGLPQAKWCYRDGQGAVLGYVYRFVKSDGGKETVPLVWATNSRGKGEWRWMIFAEKNRPLYGLDRLAARPEATVLVVEGEKCADAAQEALPDLVAVSWSGGGKAVDKSDWSPLSGRRVLTWADCDAKRVPLTAEQIEALLNDERLAAMPVGKERTALLKQLKAANEAKIAEAQAAQPYLPEDHQPGVMAMAKVQRHLHQFNPALWSVRIPAPGEKPDGWDVADAIAEGLTGADLSEWMRARTVRVPAPGAVDEIPADALGAESSESISTPTGAGASQEGSGGPGGPEDDDEWQQSQWRRMLLRKDGRLVDCRENVYLILKHHPAWAGVLWADEFAKRIVMRRPPPWQPAHTFVPDMPWKDDDALRLGLWLAQRERMIVKNVQNLTLAVGWASNEQRCHPVREYLDSLTWDNVPRLDCWLTDYMGVRSSEYSALAGRFFLLSMVARIYEPGCQMRFMPIFEGRQFRGKSSAFRILGGQWFSDTPLNLHNKDSYQNIQGVWVYEIAELDSFSRADATLVKAFVSSQTDRFRAPYAAAPEDHGRQGVFGGSTNEVEYFKDSTGNTRYWPLLSEEVDSINLVGLAEHRDQLLAEAVVRYKAGERRYPTSEEQERLFEPEQAAREVVDPWFERVATYVASNTFSRVTALEILTECLKIEVGKIGRAKTESMSVSVIMRRLGWKKRRETSGSRFWYYERPKAATSTPESSPQPTSAEVTDVPF